MIVIIIIVCNTNSQYGPRHAKTWMRILYRLYSGDDFYLPFYGRLIRHEDSL